MALGAGMLTGRRLGIENLSIAETKKIEFPIPYLSRARLLDHDRSDLIGLFLFIALGEFLLHEHGSDGVRKRLGIIPAVLDGRGNCVDIGLGPCMRTE